MIYPTMKIDPNSPASLSEMPSPPSPLSSIYTRTLETIPLSMYMKKLITMKYTRTASGENLKQ